MTASDTEETQPSADEPTTKKTPAKKSAAKKSAAKKSTTKKSTTKKAASKKAAAKASAPRKSSRTERSQPDPAPVQLAAWAAEQLLALTGREPEGVTGMERTDDGWTVHVEVLELRRLPTTTDVLAVYEVTTDRRGDLQGYRRVRRYTRGSSDNE